LKQVVRNTRRVLAMELLTARRALDLLAPLRSSPVIEKVRSALGEIVPVWTGDRPFTADIERAAAWIGAGEVVE
jgi:histidine ammonia-lyase